MWHVGSIITQPVSHVPRVLKWVWLKFPTIFHHSAVRNGLQNLTPLTNLNQLNANDMSVNVCIRIYSKDDQNVLDGQT